MNAVPVTDVPLCSVVIPCKNEIRFIEPCLQSLLRSDYPADRMEIIAVDGGSIDGTRELLARYAAQDSRLVILDNPCGIIPVSMNIGIRRARGSAVLKADAHAAYPSDYVSKCVRTLLESGADNVGGVLDTRSATDTVVGRAIAQALAHRFGSGNSTFRVGSRGAVESDTVAFGCYRREALDRVGLYNEALVRSSDIDLNARIRHAGGRILLNPEIVCQYHPRSAFWPFVARNWVDGFWALYPLKFGGQGLRGRHAAPLVALVIFASVLLLSLRIPEAAVLAWSLLSMYAGAMLVASIHVGARESSALVAAVAPAVFAGRHVAYALGSGWGLLCVAGSRRPPGGVAKRALDLAASAVGLMVLAPLALVAAAAIRLQDGGPVLYRGRRIGLHGRPFDMLKFRTMCLDAASRGGTSTPLDDPRITRVGRLLRRYKLDELPQLVNVLKGDMSLVGPRPQVEWAVKLYSARERELLSVRPGMTDFASIRFANESEILRGSVDPDGDYLEKIAPAKIQLGLEYVTTRSTVLDLKIILATLWAVAGGNPATVLRREAKSQ